MSFQVFFNNIEWNHLQKTETHKLCVAVPCLFFTVGYIHKISEPWGIWMLCSNYPQMLSIYEKCNLL